MVGLVAVGEIDRESKVNVGEEMLSRAAEAESWVLCCSDNHIQQDRRPPTYRTSRRVVDFTPILLCVSQWLGGHHGATLVFVGLNQTNLRLAAVGQVISLLE